MINIENNFSFQENDIIVIGCSAGPDSMALVDMLLKIREKYRLSLIIAHVNHNVREQSLIEAEYMKKYCEENKLLFETMTILEYGDDNFENEARNIRYNFFESVVLKYNANYLMTAHHRDDLIETIMMRMVRGSNLKGYSGFKKIVEMDNYKIVRPLISYTKKELEEYNEENNVKYFIDATNSSDKYTRNRYRKYLLPFLKSEDVNVHHKFLKFSENLNSACNFINKERDKALKRVLLEDSIVIDKFLLEDEYIQREILYYLLSEFYQDDLILLGDKHINLLLELMKSKKANSSINLPNDVVANKYYNMLELKCDISEITSYEIELDEYATLPNGHVIERVLDTSDNSNYTCRLNSRDIALPLIARTRKIGDKMYVKGMDGSKKIKDIFINSKIKLEERDSWPIVLDSKNRIVWVPGVKKSKYDKKKNEDYDIILRYS